MKPHVHISALSALITVLYVIAITTTLNLLAVKYKDRSKLAATYANANGLL